MTELAQVTQSGTTPGGTTPGGTTLSWATLSSPVGPLAVGCSPAGVARVDFRTPGGPGRRENEAGAGQASPGMVSAARDQLAEYFAGQRQVFDLPLDWSGCSRAQHQVLSVLYDSAGYGETLTYGELAQRAVAGPDGISLPARAIGRIMGSNPLPLIVPCHRVVAGNGLGGYSGGTGIEIKRWLLIFEGALPATMDWDVAGV
ncbi:MAG TPA: methylated-DNA--[protein]-cysteine S-methyltransferase [Streptosporangiaceae bacterium]